MHISLSELRVGDEARVAGFVAGSAYADQLMRLGLIPGTALRIRRIAPLGDPVEIRFRGFSLALRPREAACLLLERP
jgi:ferrous iron transport protein A